MKDHVIAAYSQRINPNNQSQKNKINNYRTHIMNETRVDHGSEKQCLKKENETSV